MTKKVLNQNSKFIKQLINTIEPDFVFSDKPINRFDIINNNQDVLSQNKNEQLLKLKEQISSIENCNLKKNSKHIVMGDGDVDSPIMLIGEAPGKIEDNSSLPFQVKSVPCSKKCY